MVNDNKAGLPKVILGKPVVFNESLSSEFAESLILNDFEPFDDSPIQSCHVCGSDDLIYAYELDLVGIRCKSCNTQYVIFV